MRMRRRLLATCSMVISVTLSAGCANGLDGEENSAQAALEKPNLTISVVPTVDSAGFFVALQRGLFTAQGLHITYVPSTSSANSITGQTSGRFDITEGNYVSYIEAQARKSADLRIIAEASIMQQNAHVIYTLPDSPIRILSQLAGKRVAVNAPFNVDYLLDASVLVEHGISPARIHFRIVPFSRMISELQHHQIDAATLPEPFASNAELTVGVSALTDLDQGATQDFPIAGYVVTRAWSEKHPRTLAAFLRALEQGQQIADTDRGSVERAMEAYRQYDNVGPVTAAVMTLNSYPLGIDPTRLQRVANVMFQFGLLRQKFSIQQMLN